MEETQDGIDFLPAMAAASRARVEAARAALDETELRARALDSAVPPRLQLSSRRFDLIAEGKLLLPASGQLREGSEGSVLARVAEPVPRRGPAVGRIELPRPAHAQGRARPTRAAGADAPRQRAARRRERCGHGRGCRPDLRRRV